ncbi:MAG: phenylalanine--tRNA ligase subunit alpha [Candidatus Abyssobacteria bacterium SURF_17]|uniref:Phenylalanine--tRNA ligase alpha subunit n=1 Tax=Candidatus Abyssobacteria bacterium SURF_17 TaxID=2093361 RepID=A0A419ETN4_9BACT|nr:MAG: phenylalanine--tRNA ligase subunit alpha [Candidatus Abyssubacteria bacterium SURF_17]
MKDELEKVRSAALEKIVRSPDISQLTQVQVEYLGRKGAVTRLLRQMGSLPAEERPVFGKLANELKDEIQKEIDSRRAELEKDEIAQRLTAESVDVTLPGIRPDIGHLHPITLVFEEIRRIFEGLGFQVATGPEVETEYHNFEALNMPRDHPARDMQDTFYINDEVLLRTHTSPVQIRVMLSQRPPVRVIAPGKVFRRDDDVTHSPMFHQVEGLAVDENITLGDLKGVLEAFVHRLYGPQTALRFRPSFFPFTEPSAEVDIRCVICGGGGCRTCSNSGWLEILGSGMVHPKVFEAVGYDPERYTGFAFGVGVDRLAMLKYGIEDIRMLYENDIRFLSQF